MLFIGWQEAELKAGLFSFLCWGSPDTTFVMKISRCLVPSVAFLFLSGCDSKEGSAGDSSSTTDAVIVESTEVTKVAAEDPKEDEGSREVAVKAEPEDKEEEKNEEEKPLGWKSIIRDSEKCVVSLDAGDSIGTGFFVSQDGLVATNYHVIEGARVVKAKNYQGFTLVCRGIVAADEERDLAILKFAASDLPFLKLSQNELPEKGEEVVAIGNPEGLDSSVTRGIVSAIRRESDLEVIQFDAAVSPGSSGSPVIGNSGEVFGVASFVLKGRQGYNFAVASKHLSDLLGLAQSLEVVTFAEYAVLNGTEVPPKPEPAVVANNTPAMPAEQPATAIDDGGGCVVGPDVAQMEQELSSQGADEALVNLKVEALEQFWQSYWAGMKKQSGAAWAVHFMDGCDYQYKKGKANRSDVAKGAVELKTKYPTRVYNLLSGPKLVELKTPGRIGFDFDFEYFYANGSKIVGGISKTELALTWVEDEWLIDKFREKVESYDDAEKLFNAQRSNRQTASSTRRTALSNGEAGFMTTANGSAYIWNNSFQKGDGAQWNGRSDDDGFASGEGTLSWLKDGSFRYSYTGLMSRGKFDGPVTTLDWRGHRGSGQYLNGKKAGRWYYKSNDGKRNWTKDF